MPARVASLLGAALLLGGCAGASAGEARTIRIEHSRFAPGAFEVAAGETVTFTVVNDDPIDHEVIIGDEAVQRLHESGDEQHHGEEPGEISVAALSTAETTVTFGAPGRVFFGCHLPGHYAYGMKGVITIE